MDCIILAGGFGKRLQNVIFDIPKPLALIGNTPFLEYLLYQIQSWQVVDRVIFSIGHLGDKIEDFLRDKTYPFKCLFSKEKSPLGTGGALLQAMQITRSNQVLAMNGDSYLDLSIQKLLSSHKTTNADVTIACLEVENSSRYGSIETCNTLKITNFSEKATTCKSLINGGVYCINRDLFLSLPLKGPCSLETKIFPYLLKYNLYACPFAETFIDIGTKSSYQKAQTILRNICTKTY